LISKALLEYSREAESNFNADDMFNGVLQPGMRMRHIGMRKQFTGLTASAFLLATLPSFPRALHSFLANSDCTALGHALVIPYPFDCSALLYSFARSATLNRSLSRSLAPEI